MSKFIFYGAGVNNNSVLYEVKARSGIRLDIYYAVFLSANKEEVFTNDSTGSFYIVEGKKGVSTILINRDSQVMNDDGEVKNGEDFKGDLFFLYHLSGDEDIYHLILANYSEDGFESLKLNSFRLGGKFFEIIKRLLDFVINIPDDSDVCENAHKLIAKNEHLTNGGE